MRVNDIARMQMFQGSMGNFNSIMGIGAKTQKFPNVINPLNNKMNAKNKMNVNSELLDTEAYIKKLAAQKPDWDWSMCINGKDPSSYQKIIKVSDEAKRQMIDIVHREFTEGRGFTDGEELSQAYKDYRETIEPETRLSATYTLAQFRREAIKLYREKIDSHYPGWKSGDYFDEAILDDFDPWEQLTSSSSAFASSSSSSSSSVSIDVKI